MSERDFEKELVELKNKMREVIGEERSKIISSILEVVDQLDEEPKFEISTTIIK